MTRWKIGKKQPVVGYPQEYLRFKDFIFLKVYEHYKLKLFKTKKLNSMVWVRERTIPTERPPLVSEVIDNFLRIEDATWSAWRIPTAVFSLF
jgi:hypothetical protein